MQAKAGPVEDSCGTAEKLLAIAHGGSGDAFVQKIENGESERLFLFLWFAPARWVAIRSERSGCKPVEVPEEVRLWVLMV